jgi:hypothetical protein
MAVSLILPVRLPVIPVGKAYGNTLNYLVFVDRKGEKIGLKSPISLFFSLLPGCGLPGDRFRRTAPTANQIFDFAVFFRFEIVVDLSVTYGQQWKLSALRDRKLRRQRSEAPAGLWRLKSFSRGAFLDSARDWFEIL